MGSLSLGTESVFERSMARRHPEPYETVPCKPDFVMFLLLVLWNRKRHFGAEAMVGPTLDFSSLLPSSIRALRRMWATLERSSFTSS